MDCVNCNRAVGLEPGLEWEDEDFPMCHLCEIDMLEQQKQLLTKALSDIMTRTTDCAVQATASNAIDDASKIYWKFNKL